MEFKKEIQLTRDLTYNHDLDNNDNFSPDDQWLVYDTRTELGGIGGNGTIEKVHVVTGEKKVLYHIPENKVYGPGVGAVSYSHTENQVAFIHGLLNCSETSPYQQWRRSGVIIDENRPEVPIFMDARDVEAPFTVGALRGGTHRHEWSGDGKFIGFTYNDAIMKQLEDSTGSIHNLRTIGVSKRNSPVVVENENAENFSGEWFSVLVVNVVPEPTPGSDEISRAARDSWVGHNGYLKKNGKRQRARAFIGTVKNSTGESVDEVFLVDIPEDITQPNENSFLEGTATNLPAPPKGANQRRLTFTSESERPGCEGIVRSSNDGSLLAFLAYDKNHVKQVYAISPLGGEPQQLTFHKNDVLSGVRWHPNRQEIIYVQNNSIHRKKIDAQESEVLTQPTNDAPTNLVWSHDGKTIAYNRMVKNAEGEKTKQIFLINV
ncbi:DUF3748 domain-containing protein [Cytophaga sp. FL35]|uniref:DUF3748 domain-containing protein n=1 Tax=Cytophaga sp. FL35 TaxID=1904456 RepID=UPI00257069E8|nr:DUF3748 domain-containing protein [Cytophaga sp. FL35]